MVVIPSKLMMSPVTAHQSPDIGHIFRDNPDVFRHDDVLIVFLMYERSRGSKSFYYPFLSMLPEPDTLIEWDKEELEELQDRYDGD